MAPGTERKETVLVLGATGHLGQAMVRALLSRGYSVTATTRQSHPPGIDQLEVEIVRGDVARAGQLDEWIEGHSLVVDAGAPRPLARFLPEEGDADSEAFAKHRTRALLDAVAKHRARLAFVSSFVTLDRARPPASAMVSRWRHASHPYFRAKKLMEEMVIAEVRRGLPVVIVNPGAYLGPWAFREDTSLVHLVLAGKVPIAADHVVNVIDVRDVAASILAAVRAERFGRPIGLAGHNVSLADLASRIAHFGGVSPPFLRADARLAELWAWWGEAALAAVGRHAPRPWQAAALVADSFPMTASPDQRELGVAVRPLDDTIRDSIAWHRS